MGSEREEDGQLQSERVDAPYSGVCIAFPDNMEQVKGHVHRHTKMKVKATFPIDVIEKCLPPGSTAATRMSPR